MGAPTTLGNGTTSNHNNGSTETSNRKFSPEKNNSFESSEHEDATRSSNAMNSSSKNDMMTVNGRLDINIKDKRAYRERNYHWNDEEKEAFLSVNLTEYLMMWILRWEMSMLMDSDGSVAMNACMQIRSIFAQSEWERREYCHIFSFQLTSLTLYNCVRFIIKWINQHAHRSLSSSPKYCFNCEFHDRKPWNLIYCILAYHTPMINWHWPTTQLSIFVNCSQVK